MSRIEELRALADKATPGPWRWEVNLGSKSINLVGGRPLFDKLVMDFTRWGMGSAGPRFNEAVAGREYNVMARVSDQPDWLAPFPGREHHESWCQTVTHPDGAFMAAASPDVVLALLDCAEALRDWMTKENPTVDECAAISARAHAALAKLNGDSNGQA